MEEDEDMENEEKEKRMLIKFMLTALFFCFV